MNPRAAERLRHWCVLATAVVVFALSLVGSEFQASVLVDGAAWRRGASFISEEWWPPRLDGAFLRDMAEAAASTLAIAWLGTMLAVATAVPLALAGTRSIVFGARFATRSRRRPGMIARLAYLGARGVGALCRSVPEVVWALVFVRAYDLGAVPAILALAIAYGGMLAKVYSEQIEALDPAPLAAIEDTGAGRLAAFAWGVLPQALPGLVDYTIYRFECAVRASALMGFVGAAGLGFELQQSQLDWDYNAVLTEVLVLVLLVVGIERITDRVRARLS